MVTVTVDTEIPLDSCNGEDKVLLMLLVSNPVVFCPDPVSYEDEAVIVLIIAVELLVKDCALWEVVLDMAVLPVVVNVCVDELGVGASDADLVEHCG
jgi:hypothetical protein